MHLHFFYDRSGALGQLSHDGLRPCVHCTGLTRGRVAMPIEQHTNGLIPATLISVLHVPMCGECFIAPRGADVEHVDVGEPCPCRACRMALPDVLETVPHLDKRLQPEPVNARTGHHRDCLCSLCTRDARPQWMLDGKLP